MNETLTEELLEDLYINKNMSTRDIASMLGYKSHTCIKRKLKQFNIKKDKERMKECHDKNVRIGVVEYWSDITPEKQRIIDETTKKASITKTKVIDLELLKDLYLNKYYSVYRISKEFEVSKNLIRNRLISMNIYKSRADNEQ